MRACYNAWIAGYLAADFRNESNIMETISLQKTFTCSRCKQQSAIEVLFLKRKYFFGLITRYYCPDCQVHRYTTNAILYFLVIPLIGLILYSISPSESLKATSLWFMFTLLVLIPLTVMHELSHTIVSLVLGFHVFRVQLGVGRPIYSKKILGLKWDIRTIPIGGFTFIGGPPSTWWYRLKLFLITLAGPTTHLVIIVVSLCLGVLALLLDVPSRLLPLFTILVLLNLLFLLVNLWPHKVNTPIGQLGTDGWQLIQILLWKPETASQYSTAYYAQMALEAKDDNRLGDAYQWLAEGLARTSDNPILLNISGMFDTLDNNPKGARKTFVQLLERPNLELAQRCLFLNNVAYVDILLEDPALLPEADQYSAEAYQHLSWEPAVAGTRGIVLIMLGKPNDGLPLLYSALKKQVDPKAKAADCCCIAIGELRLGNRAKAKTYLETARQLDPACPILAQAERELALGHEYNYR